MSVLVGVSFLFAVYQEIASDLVEYLMLVQREVECKVTKYFVKSIGVH